MKDPNPKRVATTRASKNGRPAWGGLSRARRSSNTQHRSCHNYPNQNGVQWAEELPDADGPAWQLLQTINTLMGAIAADADAAHIHMVVSNGAVSVSLSRCWHIGQQHSCGHDGTTTMGLGCLTNTKSILHGLTVASAALATASTTTTTTTSV